MNAVSVVGLISYNSTLTASSWSIAKRGIRVQCPYAGTLKIVKSSKVSSSGSATIQIRNDSDTLIKEVSVASGQSTADLNYTFTAWEIFRIVMNDSANFTSSNDYLSIANFQAFFPYALTWTSNNITDNTNCFGFDRIDLDFLWKAFMSRANRAIELPFSMFSWFVLAPIASWAPVNLNNNDQTYVTWFTWLDPSFVYYVSNFRWAISTSRGTVFSTIWLSKDTTSILLDNSWVGMKWSTSTSSTAVFWAAINITSIGIVTASTISWTWQIFFSPPWGLASINVTSSFELWVRVIPGVYRALGWASWSANITILT